MAPTPPVRPRPLLALLASTWFVTGCGWGYAQSPTLQQTPEPPPQQVQQQPPLPAQTDSVPHVQPKRGAQDTRQRLTPGKKPRIMPEHANTRALIEMRRRMLELDRLLTLGSLDRAETLLSELAQHQALQRDLVIYRIRLAALREKHEEVARGSLFSLG